MNENSLNLNLNAIPLRNVNHASYQQIRNNNPQPVNASVNRIEMIKNAILISSNFTVAAAIVTIVITPLASTLFVIAISVGSVAALILISYGISKIAQYISVIREERRQDKIMQLQKERDQILNECREVEVSVSRFLKESADQKINYEALEKSYIPLRDKLITLQTSYISYTNRMGRLGAVIQSEANLSDFIQEKTAIVEYTTNIKFILKHDHHEPSLNPTKCLNYFYLWFNSSGLPVYLAKVKELAAKIKDPSILPLHIHQPIHDYFDRFIHTFSMVCEMTLADLKENESALSQLTPLYEAQTIITFIEANRKLIAPAEHLYSPMRMMAQHTRTLNGLIKNIPAYAPILTTLRGNDLYNLIINELAISLIRNKDNPDFIFSPHDVLLQLAGKIAQINKEHPTSAGLLISNLINHWKKIRSKISTPNDFIQLFSIDHPTAKAVASKLDKFIKSITKVQRKWKINYRIVRKNFSKTELGRIKQQRKLQLADPAREVERLKKTVLKSPPYTYSQDLFFIMGRALERKKMYTTTHYVFLHAQSLRATGLNDLSRALFKIFNPNKVTPFASYFRVAEQPEHTQTVEKFFKQYPQMGNGNYTDNQMNDKILSVDAHVWNTAAGESAYTYLATNQNIMVGKQTGTIIDQIFHHYLPDPNLYAHIATRALKIIEEKQVSSLLGALNLICIPKEIIKDKARNFVYRSLAYGVKCTKYKEDQDIKVLEEHQNDEKLKADATQYRILTGGLMKCANVRCFRFSNLTPERRRYFRNAFNLLALEFHVYTRIKTAGRFNDADFAQLITDVDKLKAQKDFDRSFLEKLLKEKGLAL